MNRRKFLTHLSVAAVGVAVATSIPKVAEAQTPETDLDRFLRERDNDPIDWSEKMKHLGGLCNPKGIRKQLDENWVEGPGGKTHSCIFAKFEPPKEDEDFNIHINTAYFDDKGNRLTFEDHSVLMDRGYPEPRSKNYSRVKDFKQGHAAWQVRDAALKERRDAYYGRA